jgi:hypothetical protein
VGISKSVLVCIAITGLSCILGSLSPAQPAADDRGDVEGNIKTLYNGIPLPVIPTPRPTEVPKDPVTPPYLVKPPDVIPIDVGRQLFVDDFLVEETSFARTHHLAKYYEGNPVLKPETPEEKEGRGPMAIPGSVFHDPQDGRYKMWYMCGYVKGTAYATSRDGVHWERPALDVREGTNVVHQYSVSTAWIDLEEKNPAKRYKLFQSRSGGSVVPRAYGIATYFSADGIHWTEPPILSGSVGDASTMFWNPFRKVWVYSLRHGWGSPRRRRYFETEDFVNGARWAEQKNAYDGSVPWMWIGSDSADPPREDFQVKPQLYNMNSVAYESLILGLFTIWRGDARDKAENPPAKVLEYREAGRPKIKEICVGFSRDGYNWWRPDRRPFCPVSEKMGDWNWGNVDSAGGCCIIVGDTLRFYVSGRAGKSFPGCTDPDAGGSTGLATLRRDGFTSMDAGDAEALLTTRCVVFGGKHLFVNVDDAKGELCVEVLDRQGRVIEPFTRANCQTISTDKTLQRVGWRGAQDLSSVSGKPVKFRFTLKNGSLYAFWVSPEETGASHGYVAAGGPGFTGPLDTVGSAGMVK